MMNLLRTCLLIISFLGLSQADQETSSKDDDTNCKVFDRPIDIVSQSAVFKGNNSGVTFQWSDATLPFTVTAHNIHSKVLLKGKIVKVDTFNDVILLNSITYRLANIMIYWGSSLHYIDGTKYSGEIEMEFFSNIDYAGPVMVSFLLQETPKFIDIEFIRHVKYMVSTIVDADDYSYIPYTKSVFSPASMMPEDGHFYIYSSGDSKVNCKEHIVFKTAIPVSTGVFEELKKMKDHMGSFLKSSFIKPMQPMIERTVYRNF